MKQSKVNWSKFDTIFFDVGQTLIYPKPSYLEMCQRVAASNDINLSEAILAEALTNVDNLYDPMGNCDSATWTRDESIHQFYANYYGLVFKQVFSLIQKNYSDEFAMHMGQLVHGYFKTNDYWGIYDDVVPVLDNLVSRGYVLGIFSDWHSGLDALLQHLGLRDYFQYLYTSVGLNISKSQVGAYNQLLDVSKITPETTLYIGDSYERDYKPSSVAGFSAILLNRDKQSIAKNVREVDNLNELLCLLTH